MILYGSNLGDANAHSTTNMPVLLAGGGFRHAGHLAFDRNQNYPLPNLFVSIISTLKAIAGSPRILETRNPSDPPLSVQRFWLTALSSWDIKDDKLFPEA
jgi:hypothetical protein